MMCVRVCYSRLGRPRVAVDLSWAELRIGAMCSDGVSAADDAGIVQCVDTIVTGCSSVLLYDTCGTHCCTSGTICM